MWWPQHSRPIFSTMSSMRFLGWDDMSETIHMIEQNRYSFQPNKGAALLTLGSRY